jgi:hydroxyacylglutathione hydrolase
VPALLKDFPVPVFGPLSDGIAQVTVPLSEGDTLQVPSLDLTLQVLDVPGHTRGHIAYYCKEPGWLFCGDTLFAGGCGRLFEGTPEQMVNSLDKLATLPDKTQIFCAHEYTLANLRFANEVEPDNMQLTTRIRNEHSKREQGFPTVPSTIGLEKATNPFLRFREPHIADRLMSRGIISTREPIAVFAALREWKNSFR